MFKKMLDVIANNEFRLIVLDKKIDIINYKSILLFDDNKIIIDNKNNILTITGNNLIINKLLKDEVLR